jgi:hypothetical protein
MILFLLRSGQRHRSTYLYNRKILKMLAMNDSLKKTYHRLTYHMLSYVVRVRHSLLRSGQRHRSVSVIVPHIYIINIILKC